tara:strand:- start:1050 stop:1598 length:549 start_codon:yes stop_codon:yes gene_type:complete
MNSIDEYKIPYGIMAEFENAADTMHAAEKIRDEGYTIWDVHSPFPVHGMDDAMGLGNSNVGWFTFFGGLLGFTGGMIMIWYMNSFDYDIPVGGKPNFSPMGNFPVAYELTILLGAFGTLFGMFFLNKLPRHHNPLLKNLRFADATHDKFYIVIEADDPKYEEENLRSLFKDLDSNHIEVINE